LLQTGLRDGEQVSEDLGGVAIVIDDENAARA
jgi:hypothetical protein